MRLRSFILPALLLAATAATAFAQDGTWIHVGSDTISRGPRLTSPAAPAPNFPLRVWVRLDVNRWDYSNGYYTGYGHFALAGPTAQPIHFGYECGETFAHSRTTQFQARWKTPGKKLEVLFAPEDKFARPHTCTLTASSYEPQRLPRNVYLPGDFIYTR